MTKPLNKLINNYISKNSDQVVIASIMFTLSIVSTFYAITEYHIKISIPDFFDVIIEAIFYILFYLILEAKTKCFKLNIFLRSFIIIFLVAVIWSLVEFNFEILFYGKESSNYLLMLITKFSHEFADVFTFVFSALIIQLIINKLIINNLYRQQAGFIGKIPASQRKNIYLIKSKENYIDVYYGDGNEHKLINYRLSNALKEIPIDKGLQVHRSFWVSMEFIKTLQRIDGKYYLNVRGEKIPVSNTYLKKIKQIKEEL